MAKVTIASNHAANTVYGSQQLPVIDISGLLHKEGRQQVADEIGQAAESVGFFYIANHGVGGQLISSVHRHAEQWFNQPLEHKQPYYIGWSKNHRGYVPQSEKGFYADEGSRNYEAFDLALDLPYRDPDVTTGHPLLGPNRWPTQPGFRRIVSHYYGEMARVGRLLAGAFEDYFGAPRGALTDLMQKPTSQLRLLHYLECDTPSESDMVNMGAHTDYECFTILHQGGPGLEVLNMHGQWVPAPPIPGTFAVNIGDMLETWSNGRLRSTPHRVVHLGAERYSFPYFAAFDFDARIEPLAHLVHSQSNRYPDVIAGHHLLGQLLRDFPYLNDRYQRGRLKLSFPVPTHNPFERSKLGVSHSAEAA
ncbi:MAG: isopenicillin N synthase family oxygenase [Gammaproteobacteria bacterium]|nr:isopenicillin N synthase family oxygenase [Gammaproteobacteria bacterium]